MTLRTRESALDDAAEVGVTGRRVLVPGQRAVRWVAGFEERHGAAVHEVRDGGLLLLAADGASALVRLPFDRQYAGPPDLGALVSTAAPPDSWAVLLVRKGGFAIAHLTDERVLADKIGRRHVQGRSAAGGQSQQRFARRRDHQTRKAFAAAADCAARVLDASVEALVTGGDRAAVAAVLADSRLTHLVAVRTSRWLPVPDPRRSVLERALADARALEITVVDNAADDK